MKPLQSLPLFLLLVSFLAGCLSGPDDSVEPWIGLRIDGSEPCPTQWVTNCEEAKNDPNSPWILAPLRLERGTYQRGDKTPSHGLHLVGLERGLIVEDFEIDGFDKGVTFEEMACTDCRFEFRSGIIRGPDGEMPDEGTCPLGQTPIGIHFRDVPNGSLHLDGVDFDMGGGGVFCIQNNLSLYPGGSLAVLGGKASDYSFHNINATARLPSAAPAFRLSGPGQDSDGRVSIEGVKIRGFRDGFTFEEFHRVDVHSVIVECGPAAREFYDDASSRVIFDAAHGIGLFFVQNSDLQSLKVTDCNENGVAFVANRHESFRMSNFTLSGLQHGMVMESGARDAPDLLDSEVRFGNGLVTNNSLVGLRITPGSFDFRIEGVEVSDNGRDWESDTDDLSPGAYGGLSLRNALDSVVTDSSIHDNEPYGLSSMNSDGEPNIIQAPDNWWGHSSGPHIEPLLPSIPTLAVGEGDAVSEGVVFAPWRESP